MGKPKFEQNEERRETRSSKQVANLASSLEQFTEAVKNKGSADSVSTLDDEMNSPLYQLMLSVKNDVQSLKDSVKEDVLSLKEDIRSIHTKLDTHNKRIDDLETFATNSRDIAAKQSAFNTEVFKEMENFEKSIKSRQAILSSNTLNSHEANFNGKVKLLLTKVGASNSTIDAIDVSRLGKVKNVAVLTFSTLNVKLGLYATIKNWKDEWKKMPADQRNPDDDIFMNDFLTKRNLDIFKKLRVLKSTNKIHSVFSFNNSVYVKIKNKDDDPVPVRSINEIQKFA